MKPAARRKKGIRGELLVRDYLQKHGFSAKRVPLSGSMEGYKGDVVAERNGTTYTFEVKLRKDLFNNVYSCAAYFIKNRIFAIYDEENNVGFCCSYDFDLLLHYDRFYASFKSIRASTDTEYKQHISVIRKIFKMRRWLKGSDYLVLKGDFRPFLFISYIEGTNAKDDKLPVP